RATGYARDVPAEMRRSIPTVALRTRVRSYKVKREQLFGAEGAQGVDLGGATRRQIAGSERHSCENCGHGEKGSWVVGRDFKAKPLPRTGQAEGAGQADSYAEQREAHSLAEDHAHDFCRARSDGHAHADFMGALTDGQSQDSAD